MLPRALERADLGGLRSFVNDPAVARFSSTFRPNSDAQQEVWWERTSQAADAIWFGIEDLRTTCPISGESRQDRRSALGERAPQQPSQGRGVLRSFAPQDDSGWAARSAVRTTALAEPRGPSLRSRVVPQAGG